MMRIILSSTLFLILATTVKPQVNIAKPSAVPVHEFTQTGRALNLLGALAEKYHIVIGFYGTIVGSDDRSVSISVKDGTLREVFDAITREDPRFAWEESSDGAVHFVTRDAPLSLMDVTLSSFDVENSRGADITDRLNHVPEISGWLKENHCDILQWLVGPPPNRRTQFSIHSRGVPVAVVLDEIAAKSGTYFWSAIRFNVKPCEINITP